MRSRSAPPSCARCGAPAEPRQEICLQCGAELPPVGPQSGLGPLLREYLPWLPPAWVWPLVVLAFVTYGGVAVALAARHERNAAAPTFIATSVPATTTQPAPTVAPSSTPTTSETHARTTAPRTTPPPTIATTTLPVAPGAPSTTATTTPAPTTTAAPQSRGGVGSWPDSRTGWTDIIESLPESSGRAAAVATAHTALAAGLRDVGVLLSSRFASLRAGYWVVYAGVFDSSQAAQDGLATAHAHGFAGAYPAKISR